MICQNVAFTAPAKAELVQTEFEEPVAPGNIRGKTICTLISPGTELAYNYEGAKFPNFPGYAAVFDVEEVGTDVTGVKPGDRMFTMGNHRSAQDAVARDCVPVPGGLVPEHAVVARLMGVSLTTLMTTSARAGDLVLVTGCGPVGYCAACNFAAAGYAVHIAEPDTKRRALISHRGIRALHAGVPLGDNSLKGKVALVVECSGHEQAVIDGCAMLRKGGEMVLVGVPWKRKTERYMHDLLHAIFHGYIHVRSGWEWELPLHTSGFRAHSILSGFQLALQWLSEGKIPFDGLVEFFDPHSAQHAYDTCANGTLKGLFPVFTWA